MKYFLSIAFGLFIFSMTAQSVTKLYLDDDLRLYNEEPDVKYRKSKVKRNGYTYQNHIPSGKATYYFEDGRTVYATGTYNREGTQIGEWAVYHENGNLSTKLSFGDNGKPTGKSLIYDQNKNLVREVDFSVDGKFMYSTQYDAKGNIVQKGKESVEDEDDKVGKWEYYHSNGKLKLSSEYVLTYYDDGDIDDSEKVGEWTYYSKEGRPRLTLFYELDSYEDGEEVGRTLYYENGRPRITIKDDEEWEVFDEEGNPAEIIYYTENWDVTFRKTSATYYRIYNPYKNGTSRTVRDYYVNSHSIQWEGCITIVDKVDPKTDEKCEGKNTFYFENERLYYTDDEEVEFNASKIKTIVYTNSLGLKTGTQETYFEDGTLKDSYMYANGKLDGNARVYSENGQLKTKASFQNGLKQGDFEYYNEQGIPTRTVTYNADKQVGKTKYFHHKILFKNECNETVNILIKYKDLDGDWVDKAWYEAESGQTIYIADTKNNIFYFHAQTSSGKAWGKGSQITFDERSYEASKKTITNSTFEEYTTTLTCSN